MPIEITPALLNNLRQKAKAYDLKEWYADDMLVLAGYGYNITSIAQTLGTQDAEYIAAANPAVVLALVEEVEWLTDRLDALECPDCGNQPKFCTCELEQLSDNETDFVTKEEAKE